jgi:hypothetical protein
MIRNSRQLTDVEKFDKWMAVLPILRTFLPDDKKSEHRPPSLNMEALELGMQKQFADSVLGRPKFVGKVEIRGEQDNIIRNNAFSPPVTVTALLVCGWCLTGPNLRHLTLTSWKRKALPKIRSGSSPGIKSGTRDSITLC